MNILRAPVQVPIFNNPNSPDRHVTLAADARIAETYRKAGSRIVAQRPRILERDEADIGKFVRAWPLVIRVLRTGNFMISGVAAEDQAATFVAGAVGEAE